MGCGDRGSFEKRVAGKGAQLRTPTSSATKSPTKDNFIHAQVDSIYALKDEDSALLKGRNTNPEA